MLKLISIFLIFYLTKTSFGLVVEWEKCGGADHKGETSCASGLICCKQHDWYSQCRTSCPEGWTAVSSSSSASSTNEKENEKDLSIYEQCGGNTWTGLTQCATGLQCYAQSDHYSQCLTSCPGGWACSGSTTTHSGSTSGAGSTTVNPVTLPPFSGNAFPNCRFKFGGSYFPDPSYDYSAMDYISIWIGSPSPDFGTDFNKWWHGAMLEAAVKYKKMPLYYGYIIAFMARHEDNLQDCDVGSPSLCERGSDFIRKNRARIVEKYRHYAEETVKYIGKDAELVWLIEPDFWQYYGDTHQVNGPLSGAYMRSFFDDIVKAIKSQLPNSRISWDISAWLTESAMTTWWGYFKSSTDINFIHTSGGQSRAGQDSIKPNELKWGFMSTLTGKRIIADTGYGVAGGSTGHNSDWDNLSNLRARIANGVVSVTQANPKKDWINTLTQLRKDLAPLC